MGNDFDIQAQPFKQRLRSRLLKAKRDNIDDLAKKMTHDYLLAVLNRFIWPI